MVNKGDKSKKHPGPNSEGSSRPKSLHVASEDHGPNEATKMKSQNQLRNFESETHLIWVKT